MAWLREIGSKSVRLGIYDNINQKGIYKKVFLTRTKIVHNRGYVCHLFILVDLKILAFHSFPLTFSFIVHVTVARKITGSGFNFSLFNDVNVNRILF